MEPELPVGSLLVCKETPIEQIQMGDIVCFRSLNPKMLGKVITHRVIAIQNALDGSLLLETKGDANLTADSEYVSQSNLIGKVNHSAKDDNIMASVVDVMTDKIGFLILILFPTLLIAGFILRSCMMNMRRDIETALEEEKQAKKAQNQLYTAEEYAAMLARIKQELLEELKYDVSENKEQGAKSSKTE
jgi:signal peptidase